MDFSLFWIPATLAASTAQTARNALQRSLTGLLGTAGATHVRFVYGFPFAVLFLPVMLLLTGESMPRPASGFAFFIGLGAVAQILGTALMLAAMRERSFAVVTAYMKTEPVQTAAFGLVVLGDVLTGFGLAGILIATVGVIVVSYKPGALTSGGARPILMGLFAGSLFGMAAIGFRGAVLALDSGSFLMRATATLVWALGLQTAIVVAWTSLFDRATLLGILRAWRGSFGAGFLGALASQFWFIGFALTSAANVRTLALVEVVMAQIVSRRLFSQNVSRHELAGMALIVAGVALLLAGAAR